MNGGSPGPVCHNGRIQLDSLAGRSRLIANTTCGLDGQSFIGVSFDSRNLYFARFCQASPVSCAAGRFGAFRYSLKAARYSIARFGLRLTGFSYDTGGRAYEVLAPDAANGYCGNFAEETPVPMEPPDCFVVRTDPFKFVRVRAPR